MTTCEEIRTAWADNVWNDETITAVCPNIFDRPAFQLANEDLEEISHEEEINYLEYIVTRLTKRAGISDTVQRLFRVELRYVREERARDENASRFNDAIDFLETIDDRVYAGLGSRWDNTVDYYDFDQEPETDFADVNGRRCVVVTYRYFGVVTTTLG